MDTQNIKTFLVLAKYKNFSLAAKKLFVVQSTITKRISELEKTLGRQLFNRDKKHVELTFEGIMFKDYAEHILELEKDAIQEINHLKSYRNKLRIGSTYTIYQCYLYPIISSFLKDNTDTSIKILQAHSQELIYMLDSKLLNGAFSYIPYNKTGYECTHFVEDELILVTSPKNINFIEGITKNDLFKIDYLMCDLALEAGQFIRTLFPPYYQFRFEIDNSTKLLQYLVDGFGYSFLPKALVKNYLDNNLLISIPLIDFNSPKINTYFIYETKTSCIKKILNELNKFKGKL